ncbi:hypothetical protein HRI_003132000 [Hibiscus trionum]|uniref:Reverse transcriptase zinc-binding domain-containing protein n=1 Tax=Hibiscus trionum TaxID=183268 RepID=A0A9W7IGB2_HIBTR|nr:hypothetical protein HRI_003132000 [Hibiscus trionum]
MAGRITLVKSVLSNLPVYYLSIFRAPVSVANSLNRLFAKFIWGHNKAKAIHWIKWDTLCLPRDLGGMGLVDVKVKNQALLNKWLWCFGTENDKLWRRVIVAKYGLSNDNLTPCEGSFGKESWVWRNISRPARNNDDPFTKHLKFLLGDGKSINFWEDQWTDFPSLRVAFPRIFSISVLKSGKVCEYGAKVDGSWQWNIPLRRCFFDWEINQWESFMKVLSKAASTNLPKDELRWTGNSNEVYLPKDFGRLLSSNSSSIDPCWRIIWAKCPALFADNIKLCARYKQKYKWEITFAYREANVTAHLLARKGARRGVNWVWINSAAADLKQGELGVE